MLDLVSRGCISEQMLMAAFELSRQQAAILYYLLWHEYADADGLAGLVSNPSVPMHRLKARLRKYDISITTRRGLGYLLNEEMQSKVLSYIELYVVTSSYPQELPA